ncbi:type II toxin-antitoxin system VapC family toxin [Methanobrevibacter sp. UBA212]|uniref:type II toxin-antitoxin system VapC family toxin n=1 Tax=Methanobrevibacter sp. UBA212 TaxID=1915476 RepID=UPI0025ECC106|nr:type II toxin-antitoxin system VapC family toxin [Methanobrevibacter sp. UBA212]
MIFLDTGYFVGLLDDKDSHHEDSLKIKEFLDDLNETTVINTTVLVETLNKSVGTCDVLKDLYMDIRENNLIIPLSYKDYLKSLEINGWYGNSINYSDCTIIKTMIDYDIQRIVSFDSGFDKIKSYEVISRV